MKQLLKITGILGLCGVFLAGCQPTPETEAIARKQDINKVVEQHQNENGTENEGIPLREALGVPDTASFEIHVGDGSMMVTADQVPVIVPDTDKAGSCVISKAEFTLEQVKTMTEKFFDGRPVNKIKPITKEDKLAAIARLQEEINNTEDEAYRKELEDYIRVYEEGIDELPAEASLTVEPIEFEWTNVNGGVGINGENRGDGKYYLVTASVLDDLGSSLFLAEENEERSIQTMEKSELDQNKALNPQYAVDSKDYEAAFSTLDCTYTQEQAVDMCLDFLESAGIDTSALFVTDVQPYICIEYNEQKVLPGIQGYNIYMSHGLGEMSPVRADNQIMYIPGDSDVGSDSEGTIPYLYESLKMSVDSSGINLLEWRSYMTPGEVLAERVALKPYSEIEKIIQNHIAISYENLVFTDAYENGESLKLSKITLSMMRIQNENEEEKFTLIPVWDVFSEMYGNTSIMTVNAMDGSIISRERGY